MASASVADIAILITAKDMASPEVAAAGARIVATGKVISRTMLGVGAATMGTLSIIRQLNPVMAEHLKWVQVSATALMVLGGIVRFVTSKQAQQLAMWLASEAAIVADTVALTVNAVVTKAQAAATWIAVAAQWALNAAMLANPIGLIILGVAALAGAIVGFVYLVKHHWRILSDVLFAPWKAFFTMAEIGINFIIKSFNRIGSIKLPSWIPGVGGKSFGMSIPEIKLPALMKFAEGGIVNRPTIAMIGERGPEAVLPLKNRGLSAMIGERGPEAVSVPRVNTSVLQQEIHYHFDIGTWLGDREGLEKLADKLLPITRNRQRLATGSAKY